MPTIIIAFLTGWFTFLILEILLELKKISTRIEINNQIALKDYIKNK